ncbi:uncharacterized protein LOC110018550 [Phalaenopsis equestris]|uniref:uncharacterized protein LOC110018550 n=1 Tax=Phalaenopsis equestris TaxID=78828 RepID=UPI0009E33177|nr:uncharacterized protein LOC110018550 [Phalaenopsis equestris]
MMNLLSLSLLISSLVAACFLSPPSNPNPPVHEGRPIIVVEQVGPLPPPSSSPPPPVSGKLSENFEDTASDMNLSSPITEIECRTAQLEESNADAVKSASAKVNGVGEDVAVNTSTATRKPFSRVEATAAKLEENITDILRRARDLGRDFMIHVATGARRAARSSAAIAHLFGFSIAFGSCVWVTFVSSHVLASALPRQQFGIVQSRIYPVYFGAVCVSVLAAVAAFFIERGWKSTAEKVQGYNLLGVLGMTMVNMFYLEPRATKVMFERMKLEKEEGRRSDLRADGGAEPAEVVASSLAPTSSIDLEQKAKRSETTAQETLHSKMLRASKTLGRLNAISSFLNVLSLMALGWHLVYLAQRLGSSCSFS